MSRRLLDECTIELLVDGEARWRERAVMAEMDRENLRVIVKHAINLLHDLTVERDALLEEVENLRAVVHRWHHTEPETVS